MYTTPKYEKLILQTNDVITTSDENVTYGNNSTIRNDVMTMGGTNGVQVSGDAGTLFGR
jgi:hypothetical protein